MRVLCVGIATIDIINVVDGYPHEDDEVRAIDHRVSRGGNAANTAVILSRLGCKCDWAGVLVKNDPDLRTITDDFEYHKVACSDAKYVGMGKNPTSYINLNQNNGSRTIVHYRHVPEYAINDFAKIDLSVFDWIHFEGRHIAHLMKMLQMVKQQTPSTPISLEVEKNRPGIETLFSFPDVMMFSRSYINAFEMISAEACFRQVKRVNPHAVMTCTWGEQGACAITESGELIVSEPYPPKQIVDTLGAGDVFNAGIIFTLLNQGDLQKALTFACHLAGEKCGHYGFAYY